MAEAVARGAGAVITCGSAQSNHCRCTAAAARKLGLDVELVLFEGRHNEPNGNLLLDNLLGAKVEMRPLSDRPHADDLMAAAAARHPNAYVIPFGGSNDVGTAAYVWGYQELAGQLGAKGIRGGTLVCVTSSGATHAGLALGAALDESGPRVVGVSIADPVEACRRRVVALVREAAALLGVDGTGAEVTVLDGQQGGGYGVPTPASVKAIRDIARLEGLFLDPVYTSKAMAGLIASARDFSAPLVFLHSGGTPALFAYSEELYRPDPVRRPSRGGHGGSTSSSGSAASAREARARTPTRRGPEGGHR
jgi:D-cysteine desulfhydrase